MKSCGEIQRMEEQADEFIRAAQKFMADQTVTADGVRMAVPLATAWALMAIERRLAVIAGLSERADQ